MTTAYEKILDEYRDAAASVRVAMSAHADARAAQIIANRDYNSASSALQAATDRLARADDALTMAQPEAPTPPDIDVMSRVLPSPFGIPFNQQFAGQQFAVAALPEDEQSEYPSRAE